jgi:hypothetical protein
MAVDRAFEIGRLDTGGVAFAAANATNHDLDAAIAQGSLEGMAVQEIIASTRRWHEQREELTQPNIGEQDVFDSMIHADTISKAIMTAQGD